MEARKWALSQLPCMKSHALNAGDVPPCLSSADAHVVKEISCPACSAMHDEIERIKSEAYRDGYAYLAWIVTQGPHCELVAFGSEPDEVELLAKYGDALISVVPV